MILRNIAVRHGRKALAPPLRLTLRSASTTPSSTPSSTPSDPSAPIDSVTAWSTANRIRNTTGKLGSLVSPAPYVPSRMINSPISARALTLELLLASQAHIGHATALWNPRNARYIYGERAGIHILSLEVIATYLRRAAKIVEGVSYHGGLILFIGNRAGQARAVIKAAELAGGCHLYEKWTPGSITNGNKILGGQEIKVLNEHDQEVTSEVLEAEMAEVGSLKPDLVVCLNPLENYVALRECTISNIPTIGVIDTDADPTLVTYPIPANDDSLRCINLITGVLGRAAESGKKKRLEAAKKGEVTWQTPRELNSWILRQYALDEKREKDRIEAAGGTYEKPGTGREEDQEGVKDESQKPRRRMLDFDEDEEDDH